MSASPHSIHEPHLRLPVAQWQQLVANHRQKALRWTLPARRRRASGEPHPVEDFLFTYYPFSMRKLTQWHPGYGVSIEASATLPEWFEKSPYRETDGSIELDRKCLTEGQAARIAWIRDLLVATRDRTPNFGCFGIHEWAMVYGGRDVRHRESCPMRLSQSEIDRVVEARSISCSHFDAFRFFQPEARPLNRIQPDMDSRIHHEQPGCVHSGMDLYKWASKCMPWVSSELQLDCFEVALKLRSLDMRASPYDLQSYGLAPVKVETADGRRDYEAEQRALSHCASPLRQRLIDELSVVLMATG